MIRRNVASQTIYLPQLVLAADGAAVTASATLTVAKDGSEASSAGTLAHVSNGVWKYTPTQAETDAAIVGLILTATDAVPVVLNLITTAADTSAVALGANTVTPLDAAGTRSAVGLATANLDTQLGDVPTVAEFEARSIPSADYFVVGDYTAPANSDIAAIKTKTDQFVFTVANQVDSNALSGAGGLDAAGIRSAVGLASANLDTQLADLPTVAEFEARSLPSADYFVVGDYTAPLDASGVRAAVGLATANLDTQLADIPTVAEFEARTLVAASYFDAATDSVTVGTNNDKTGYSLSQAFPANFAAMGINASGYIERVVLVDTTTVNSDMRGTDGANTTTPPTVSQVADEVQTRTIARVTLVDTVTANTDMRGTDGANTTTPPTVLQVADEVQTRTIARVTLVDTTTTNSDMRGTDGANTTTPPTVSQVADEVQTRTIARVTLVDTTTANTDMRGTDNALLASGYTAPANSDITAIKGKTDQFVFTVANQVDSNALSGGGSGLDAAGVRNAVGLASANLDTQLSDIPTNAEFEARTILSADYFVVGDYTTPPTPDEIMEGLVTGSQPAGSLARFIRDIKQSDVLFEGTIVTATSDTATLDAGATTVCVGQAISVGEEGDTERQTRFVVAFDPATKVVTLDQPWCVVPDNDAAYQIKTQRNALVGRLTGAIANTFGGLLANLATMIENVSGWRFNVKALEQGPSGGGGGDATEAKQDQILAALQGVEAIQVPSPNILGNLVLTQGDTYDGIGNPKAQWNVTNNYTDGWAVVLTIRDKDDAVVYTTTGTVDSATLVSVAITTPTVAPMVGCPGYWEGKYDVQLSKAGSVKTIALGKVFVNEDQTR